MKTFNEFVTELNGVRKPSTNPLPQSTFPKPISKPKPAPDFDRMESKMPSKAFRSLAKITKMSAI